MARIQRTLVILILLAAAGGLRTEDFVKEFNSVYGHIIIQRRGPIVEMYATYRGWMARESGVHLEDPTRIVVPYVRHSFAAGMVAPDPENVLVIGLGGGGFNHFFNALYPGAQLTSVEIDRRVVELAKEYMAFEEYERNRVVVRDGRSFIRRSHEQYDWVFLDAFHGSVVPPHLKTLDFYREIADRLTPEGVLVSNIHDTSELFYYDLATFHKAFSDVVMLKVPDTGNVIVLAANRPAGSLERALRAFDGNPGPLWRREIDPAGIVASIMEFAPRDFARGRVMTDDFAPADYYRMIPRSR